MNKIIELKNVNKIYKTKVENIHILKNINLALTKGILFRFKVNQEVVKLHF